jgi:hypothetical protein
MLCLVWQTDEYDWQNNDQNNDHEDQAI